MIKINLIPKELKTELKLLNFYLLMKDLIFLFVLSTIIVAIILLSAKVILQNYFNKTINESYLSIPFSKLSIKEIEEFNKNLTYIIKIQNDYYPWSQFFLTFDDLIEEEIVLNYLKIDHQGRLKISGIAKDRDDLRKFKENIDNSGLFNEFEIPLEILLTKDNINFTLNLDIKLDKFFSDTK